MKSSERSSTIGIRDTMPSLMVKREPHSSPAFLVSRGLAFSSCHDLCLIEKRRINLDAQAWPGRYLQHSLFALQRRRIATHGQRIVFAFVFLMRPAVLHHRGEMRDVQIAQAAA